MCVFFQSVQPSLNESAGPRRVSFRVVVKAPTRSEQIKAATNSLCVERHSAHTLFVHIVSPPDVCAVLQAWPAQLRQIRERVSAVRTQSCAVLPLQPCTAANASIYTPSAPCSCQSSVVCSTEVQGYFLFFLTHTISLS